MFHVVRGFSLGMKVSRKTPGSCITKCDSLTPVSPPPRARDGLMSDGQQHLRRTRDIQPIEAAEELSVLPSGRILLPRRRPSSDFRTKLQATIEAHNVSIWPCLL